MLPERFTLTARVGEDDDCSDIELRAPHEKITIAKVMGLEQEQGR